MSERILLITKNYPPQIGGMEKYSYDLYNRLIAEGNEVKIITAWPRNEWLLTRQWTGKWILLKFWHFLYVISEFGRLGIFAIKCFTLWLFYTFSSDLVWSLDGSIWWIGFILAKATIKKTRVTIHGTDIVWDKKIYQAFVPKIIAKMDEVYVISENTHQECLKRWIPLSKIILMPHTLDTIAFIDPGEFNKIEFLKSLWVENPGEKVILFSIGRWIERKGFHWFLQNIMPQLDSNKFHYLIAGFGPYESDYRVIIEEKWLLHVTILWKITNSDLKAKIYTSSNIFIMPNISVNWNIEGCPIVLMEAKYYWLKRLVGYVQWIENETDIVRCYNDISIWLKSITN